MVDGLLPAAAVHSSLEINGVQVWVVDFVDHIDGAMKSTVPVYYRPT